MRTSDIWQAKQNPSYVKTEKLYVDTDTPVEQMSLEEAKRGMCAAAGNDVLKCESCLAKCKFGRRIVELLKPVPKEEKRGQKETAGAPWRVRHEKSENAYLQAIASGDPRQWFIDNGRDVRNGMVRLKQRSGDMTPEEARKRLAEKTNAEDVLVPAAKPKAKAMAETRNASDEIANMPSSSHSTVFKAKLRVSAVDGEYFNYSLYCGQMKMTSGQGTVLVNVGDIAAMCAEIVQAAEMLGGQ